ncbi:hypothetical protein DFQ30_010787 [Apophysomyces sp. BC1015]|nr:hypothetical protein DFQ30_010787 [Apophysomyces sp. BC1015]
MATPEQIAKIIHNELEIFRKGVIDRLDAIESDLKDHKKYALPSTLVRYLLENEIDQAEKQELLDFCDEWEEHPASRRSGQSPPKSRHVNEA